MEPVTHGLTGALFGKAYFSERYGKVATFAAVLGALFPDVDVTADLVSRDPLAIVKYHRAITHSFVAMPFFALLLAVLTKALVPWVRKRFSRWSDVQTPPLWVLTLIYGLGITSHILLDGMTSFGTRMWFPVSSERVAWDLLFIIDFSFAAILLIPQLLAWIYPAGNESSRDIAKSRRRAIRIWLIFSASTFLIWLVTRAAGYPFRFWVAVILCGALGILFFTPAIGGWGFRVTRDAWCQGGLVVAVAYLLGCALAHHAAMLKVRAFADTNRITVNRMGALPIPPSPLDWGDAIRARDGIYESQFDLRSKNAPAFWFIPDSPPDMYIARAWKLPSVQLCWNFIRFPTIRSAARDGEHTVDLGENRFSDGRQRSPQPFTYRIVLDNSGDVLAQGWLVNGMLQQRMRRMVPQQPVPGGRTKPGS